MHKKSSTLAVLAETGKYLIAVKIFTQILKYWIRLEISEDTLLIATRHSIEDQSKKGNKNWKKNCTFRTETSQNRPKTF